ncbi:hypothetical protein FRC12_000854, partial [Ceratobasidium sp. 428]
MGKPTLQSACFSTKSTENTSHTSTASQSPVRPRPKLIGTGIPSISPNPSVLLDRALGANAVPPGFAKSLNGLPQLENHTSFSSSDKAISHSSNGITEGKNTEEDLGSPDDRVANLGLPYPLRSGVSKGHINAGARPPPAGNRPQAFEREVLVQPQRSHQTTDHYRSFGSRQAQVPRVPTRKALLVTADRSPPFGSSDTDEQLDYTSNDSERFEECLKKLNFEPKNIKVVKAVGAEFITREAFQEGLDFLLTGAVNGDMLVMLVSMHAIYIKDRGVYSKDRGVYLKFEGPNGSTVLIGARELVDLVNNKLRTVRCTVEVVLDVCYAGGLITCKHVIRQMESKASTVVVSTFVEVDVPPPAVVLPPFLTNQSRHNEADISVSHASPFTQQPIANIARHISQPLATGLPIPLPPIPQFIAHSPLARNYNPVVQAIQAIIFGPPIELQTDADILVWAAAKEHQKAYERVLLGSKNGALVDAMCTAIEKHGCLTRKDVFDNYVSTVIEAENTEWVKRVAREPAETQKEVSTEPQHAQLLSNRDYE